MDNITSETIMFMSVAALAAFVIWLLYRRFQSGAQLRLRRTETFNRLLDRFQSTDALVDFLQSDSGRRMFDEPGAHPERSTSSVIRFAGAGALLGALGIALWINASRLASRITPSSDPNDLRNLAESQNWATIVVALAVAFIIIAVVGYIMTGRQYVGKGSAERSLRS
jgi:hypothetical protein